MAYRTLLLAMGLATARTVCGLDSDTNDAMNPIRKVVTMLQAMQQKVVAEGKKEEDMYEKFMCYCKNNGGDLQVSISDANNKIPMLGTDIKSNQEKKIQTEQELEQAQTDRTAAKAAMAEAASLREKEATAFAAEEAELSTNVAAIFKAVTALEKGMGGGFLQTKTAKVLQKLIINNKDMSDGDRQTVMAFLTGSEATEYNPSSGEVTGILKEIGDTMKASLKDLRAQEKTAIQNFEELMTAKKKEVDALIMAIENKSRQIGELGVAIAQMQNDLTDSEAALIANQKLQAELTESCGTKTGEWEERKKLRGEELVALSETIKVLNDDDALDLFKKTLPSASASFVQMHTGIQGAKADALAKINKARDVVTSPPMRVRLDLVALALHGKKIGLEKVIKMVENMITTLKAEQVEDENKQEYCTKQLDEAEDKTKVLSQKVDDAETAIATAKEDLGTLKDDVKALEAGIKELDKSSAEAKELRVSQHQEYSELLANNHAAKELLGWAKNRLNKFYNKKLYKEEPKPELNLGEVSVVDTPRGATNVFAQVSSHVHHKDEPEESSKPPETWKGSYAKKSEETGGVMAMIGLLVTDLEKEITEAETEERNSMEDYQKTMADSKEKREADSKSILEKRKAVSDTEVTLETHAEGKTNTGRELMATATYISQLHGECDWLLQYFDVRKEARASEMDALRDAKAVLAGADFSLTQQSAKQPPKKGPLAPGNLRRAAKRAA